jgi:hypothetical protein
MLADAHSMTSWLSAPACIASRNDSRGKAYERRCAFVLLPPRLLQLGDGDPNADVINPDEGIWQYLKHVELRNRCCRSLGDLRTEFRLAVGRLWHKREVIRACISQCYPVL